MTIKRFRGDAPTRAKVLLLLQPNTSTSGITIIVGVGNKSLSFRGWNTAEVAQGLRSSGFAELDELAITATPSGVQLIGLDDQDFDVTVEYQPTVDVEFAQATTPLNQITRLDFSEATGGSFKLTCNGVKTSAINLLNAGGALNIGAIETAIEALASFASGDVVVSVDGGDVLLEWKGSYLKTPVSVTMESVTLNNGGQLIISEIQSARPASHDIWFMGSDADFRYNFSDGLNEVSIKTNESDEVMSEKLSAAWGGRVDVYSTLVSGTPISRRFYILNMVGFPGISTTLSVNTIEPAVSPVGVGLEKIISSTDTKPAEIYLVDTRSGGTLSVKLGNTTIDDWSDPSQVYTDLVAEGQFTEWNHNAKINNGSLDGILISIDLWLLRYQGDGPRINGSLGGPSDNNDGGQNFDESRFTVDAREGAAFTLLQHGGPTNAADSAIHSIHLKTNNPLISVSSLGGAYQLLFAEGQTADIAPGATAATVQTAINTATGVTVAVTGDGDAASPYVVDYTGDSEARALPTVASKEITGDGTGVVSADVSARFGRSAKATIRVSQAADGGTYSILSGNQGPVTFDWDDDQTTFLATLQTIPELSGAGDVTVSYDATSRQYSIDYASALAFTNVSGLALQSNALTSSTAGLSTRSITVFPSGPGNWSDPLNWSTGTLPEYGDEIVVSETDEAITYGLRQFVEVAANTTTDVLRATGGCDLQNGQKVRFTMGSVTIGGVDASTDYYVVNSDRVDGTFQVSATLNGPRVSLTTAGTGPHYCGVIAADVSIPAAFDQTLGLPRKNEDGFEEYRERFLKIGIDATGEIQIGKGDGAGSGLLRIDTGNSVGQVTVYSTSQSEVDGKPAFVWDCLSDTANLLIHDGEVGVAVYVDEVAKLGSFNVLDGSLYLGSVTVVGNAIATSGTLKTQRMAVGGLVQIN